MPHVIALRAAEVEAQLIAQRPVQRQRGVAALRVEQDGGLVVQREAVLLTTAGRGDARSDTVAQRDGGQRIRDRRHLGRDGASAGGIAIVPGVQHVNAIQRQGHALGVKPLVPVGRGDYRAAGADKRPVLRCVGVGVAQVDQHGLACRADKLPRSPLAAQCHRLCGQLAERQRRQSGDRHRQHLEAARRAAVGRQTQLVAARQQILHAGAVDAVQALRKHGAGHIGAHQGGGVVVAAEVEPQAGRVGQREAVNRLIRRGCQAGIDRRAHHQWLVAAAAGVEQQADAATHAAAAADIAAGQLDRVDPGAGRCDGKALGTIPDTARHQATRHLGPTRVDHAVVDAVVIAQRRRRGNPARITHGQRELKLAVGRTRAPGHRGRAAHRPGLCCSLNEPCIEGKHRRR